MGAYMFGYLQIDKAELKVREYEAYKSVYCGLCKQLGRDYSIFARFALSYDCTFYAITLMSLRRSCSGFKDGRCRFNPLKKCKYALCEACRLLGCSRQTLRRRETMGYIRSHRNRINGRRWYWGSDLIRLTNI